MELRAISIKGSKAHYSFYSYTNNNDSIRSWSVVRQQFSNIRFDMQFVDPNCNCEFPNTPQKHFHKQKPIRNRSNDNRVKVTQSRRRLISSLKAALKRPATLWWRWRFCAQKSRTQILKQECRRQIVNSKIKCPTGIHVTGIWRRRDASVRRRYVEDFRSSSVNWEMKQIVIGFLFFCEMVWCGFSRIRCSYDDCFGNWIL